MPDIMLFLIICFCILTSIQSWYLFFDTDDGKHSITASLISVLSIGLIIWVWIASGIPYQWNEEIVTISTIEQNGQTFQITIFSNNEAVNITKQCGVILPDGSQIKQPKLVSKCVGGVFWLQEIKPYRYEVVEKQ